MTIYAFLSADIKHIQLSWKQGSGSQNLKFNESGQEIAVTNSGTTSLLE